MTIAAMRHNNPGDVSLPIKGWNGPGKIVGVEGQAGYAEFPTMQIGFEAFQQRIRSYIDEGRATIALIGKVYATDPHWPRAVSEIAGIGLNVKLNPANASQMATVAAAIIRQETGKTLAQLGISHPAPKPAPNPNDDTALIKAVAMGTLQDDDR
jgi:hypothetical protein